MKPRFVYVSRQKHRRTVAGYQINTFSQVNRQSSKVLRKVPPQLGPRIPSRRSGIPSLSARLTALPNESLPVKGYSLFAGEPAGSLKPTCISHTAPVADPAKQGSSGTFLFDFNWPIRQRQLFFPEWALHSSHIVSSKCSATCPNCFKCCAPVGGVWDSVGALPASELIARPRFN